MKAQERDVNHTLYTCMYAYTVDIYSDGRKLMVYK
jgi:hypothetical protein